MKGFYASKITYDPNARANEDGFRLPGSHLALGCIILSSFGWLWPHAQQSPVDSDLLLQGLEGIFCYSCLLWPHSEILSFIVAETCLL